MVDRMCRGFGEDTSNLGHLTDKRSGLLSASYELSPGRLGHLPGARWKEVKILEFVFKKPSPFQRSGSEKFRRRPRAILVFLLRRATCGKDPSP